MLRTLAILTLMALPGLVAAQAPQPDEAETKRQAELAKLPQWQRMLKGEDATTAAKLYHVIEDYDQADYYAKAIQAAKELVSLRVKVQGADHYETIIAKFQLSHIETLSALPAGKREEWRAAFQGLLMANSLHAKGQYAQAYPSWKRYADLCREVLGDDSLETATSYNNVAANLNYQGKVAEALPLFQKALEIRRRVLGEDHPDTAQSYNNLAAYLLAQRKAAEAQPFLQKALEIRRKVLGEDHPDTAESYNNLAVTLNAQEMLAEAQPLHQKALEIRRRVLGEDHSQTATSYNNLATNLYRQWKLAEAQPLMQKSLEITRRLLGEEHPDIALNYDNLAMILKAQGKAAEAQPLYQKALEIRRRVLGEDHSQTATTYYNMASNLYPQGKTAEAQPLYQKALEIRRRVLGEDHPDTAQSYNSVAFILNTQGKSAEAQPIFQKALHIRRRVLGEDHLDTAQSYANVAMMLNAQGKAAEADPLIQRALEITRRVKGEDDPQTASNYNGAALILYGQGKIDDALPLFQKALEIRRRVLGEEHPDTAASYNNIAMMLNAQGNPAEAQPLLQKALEIHRRLLGGDHSETARSYNNLALILNAQGKGAEAEAYLRPAVFAYESSRQNVATGLDRASFAEFNPRLFLAVLTQAREPLHAWGELELSLARGLLDQQTDAKRNLTPAEELEWNRERERVTSVQPQIFALVTKTQRSAEETAQLGKILSERRALEERLTALAVKASTRAVASGDEIRAALPAYSVLICWVDVASPQLNVQEHWACVVRRTGEPKWERLPGTGPNGKWSQDDTALPAKFRAALSGSLPRAEVDFLARQLQAQRLAPILQHLDGVTTLYVVGVNEMAGIPVEALTADYTISYVPSGTFLARRGKPVEKPASLLALGDPSFPAQQKTPAPTALPPGGLLIQQVVPGGPAAKALLKPNDVLVSYAGTNIESIDQLRQVLATKLGEKSVAIQIWREAENKLATYDMATGNPGFALAIEPAREAIATRRKADQLLASVNRGEWGELPGSQVEISELSKLFDSGSVTVLTRSDASEPALDQLRKKGDLTKFRYLHFATHGEANNVRAFDSKLILAQDHPKQLLSAPGEPLLNNELSAREVLDLWKLDADLVTLSACETAIGKSGGGDGMLGFAQAFLLAGSRSVCLSLWKVDDTATALLMDRFYRNLLGKREDGAKPMGKAAALHEAKTWLKNLTLAEATDRLGVLTDGVSRGSKKGREVIGEPPSSADSALDAKPYSHPKYWAAFILIGDPD